MTMHERNLEIVTEYAKRIAFNSITRFEAIDIAEALVPELCKANKIDSESSPSRYWDMLLHDALLSLYELAINNAAFHKIDLERELMSSSYKRGIYAKAIADKIAGVRQSYNAVRRNKR